MKQPIKVKKSQSAGKYRLIKPPVNEKAPQGFRYFATACGIKSDPTKADLAIIYSENPESICAGVFTRNTFAAAPVKICRKNSDFGYGRVILVNSGCANALTGEAGFKDAEFVVEQTAKYLGVAPNQILPCSTGKIGERLPLEKIKRGLNQLHADGETTTLSSNFEDVSRAIMTTDAYSKTAFANGRIGGKNFKIAIMAKGAGMIHPDMATLLCFVVTDLKLTPALAKRLLKDAVDPTLNSLSVDGDTSTNDTTLLLANGLAENPVPKVDSKDYQTILSALKSALEKITVLIARDGEGATKCFKVSVTNARSDDDAKKIARAIGNSPLVKTAMFGCDPNWGRILCAAGYSGAKVDEKKLVLKLGKHLAYDGRKGLAGQQSPAAQYLRENDFIEVNLDLGLGKGSSQLYASDLTRDYVTLNADYRT